MKSLKKKNNSFKHLTLSVRLVGQAILEIQGKVVKLDFKKVRIIIKNHSHKDCFQ